MNSPYLSCLKTYWAEIWNLCWLPPNILLAPILVLLWPSLILFFQYISMYKVISSPWAGPQSRSCHLFAIYFNALNCPSLYFIVICCFIICYIAMCRFNFDSGAILKKTNKFLIFPSLYLYLLDLLLFNPII